jgi:hypothetical protein
MYGSFEQHLRKNRFEDIESAGLYKRERVITGPQQSEVSRRRRHRPQPMRQ